MVPGWQISPSFARAMSPPPYELPTLPVVEQRPAPQRARLVRRARGLAWLGVGWHALEAAIAIGAGLAAGSIGARRLRRRLARRGLRRVRRALAPGGRARDLRRGGATRPAADRDLVLRHRRVRR